MKEKTGMPINIFFIPDENGSLEVCFNGRKIERKEIIKCRNLLDKFLKKYSEKDIELYNKSVDEWIENINNEDNFQQEKSPIEGYIYIIKNLNLYKIGRTKSIKTRVRKYVTENPHNDIELIMCGKVCDYIKIETELLRMFFKKKFKGEWFNLNKTDLIKIKKYLNEN